MFKKHKNHNNPTHCRIEYTDIDSPVSTKAAPLEHHVANTLSRISIVKALITSANIKLGLQWRQLNKSWALDDIKRVIVFTESPFCTTAGTVHICGEAFHSLTNRTVALPRVPRVIHKSGSVIV